MNPLVYERVRYRFLDSIVRVSAKHTYLDERRTWVRACAVRVLCAQFEGRMLGTNVRLTHAMEDRLRLILPQEQETEMEERVREHWFDGSSAGERLVKGFAELACAEEHYTCPEDVEARVHGYLACMLLSAEPLPATLSMRARVTIWKTAGYRTRVLTNPVLASVRKALQSG